MHLNNFRQSVPKKHGLQRQKELYTGIGHARTHARTHHHRVRVPNSRVLNRRERLSSPGDPRSPTIATGPGADVTYAAAAVATDTILSTLEAHVFAGELGDHREEELHGRAGVRGAVHFFRFFSCCVALRCVILFCFVLFRFSSKG